MQVAVRPAGWRWRGTGTRSTHGKAEGAAVAAAVVARLSGLQEEESVLLEALVPTARLPAPPPRKTPPRAPTTPGGRGGREGPPRTPTIPGKGPPELPRSLSASCPNPGMGPPRTPAAP